MGTAVHLDGWGGFLTAEHVIEFLRAGLPQAGLTGRPTHDLDPTEHSHPVLLLGIGLGYGEVAVPEWAFAPITDTLTVTRERDDPLAALQGKRRFEIAQDVASLQAAFHPAAYDKRDPPQTLPVQLTGWEPTVGEQVLAFGYPELKPSAALSDSSLRILIEDGLFAAYGTITRVFPRGRDLANPTPVFEVAANWPSGMSGRPVVNALGNVIGLASRSLAPGDDLHGVGYAACLPWINEVRQLAPRVDPLNPGFRLGYAVRDDAQQRLAGVWPTRQLAHHHATQVGSMCQVFACAHRIGTDEYVRVE